MANAVGLDGIHNVTGICDLCGNKCDANLQELNALDCTFPNCPSESNVYHQDCLEKYLKSVKLEKNRKTGFKCPRGCGKGSQYGAPCPGKIDKSHPIISRSDTGKKRRKAKLPEPAPPPAPKDKAAAKQKAKEEQEAKAKKESEAKAKVSAKVQKKDQPEVSRDQMLAAARAARKELGLVQASPKKLAAASLHVKEVKTLEEYEAMRMRAKEARDAQLAPVPVVSAWSKTPASAPATAPQPMLSSLFPQPSFTKPAAAASPEVSAWSSQPKGAWAANGGNGISTASPAAGVVAPEPQQLAAPPAIKAQMYQVQTQAQRLTTQYAASAEAKRQATLVAGNDASDSKLTKAQKKNMKRAEKKAAQRKIADGSDAGSESSAATTQLLHDTSSVEVESPSPTSAWAMCASLIRQRKLHDFVSQLTQLGFQDWQARSAIARYGLNIEAAASWLLEVGNQNPADAPKPATLDSLDVDAELSSLAEVQVSIGCSRDDIAAALMDQSGDVNAAIAVLYERSEQDAQPSPPAPLSRQGSLPQPQRLPNGSSEVSQQHDLFHHSSLSSSPPSRAPPVPTAFAVPTGLPRQQQVMHSNRQSIDSSSDVADSLDAAGITPSGQKLHSNGHGSAFGGSFLTPASNLGSFMTPAAAERAESAGGLFSGSFSSHLKSYMGGQTFTDLVNGPQLDSGLGLRREAHSTSELPAYCPSERQEWMGLKHSATGIDALSSMAERSLLPFPAVFGSDTELFHPYDSHRHAELPADLALGSELLGLVDGEDQLQPEYLPAFFGGGPLVYDTPLEDQGLGEALVPAPKGLAAMSPPGGSMWSLGSLANGNSDPGPAWGMQEAPEAALLAAAAVSAEDMGSSVMEAPGDDRELNALMATLVCQ